MQPRLDWDREGIRRAASLKGKARPAPVPEGPALDARTLRRMHCTCEALAPKTMQSSLLLGAISGLVLFGRALVRLRFLRRCAGMVFGW